MRKYILLLSLLSLGGCTIRDGVHYSFKVNNPDDMVYAQEAITEWNKCTPTVQLSIEDDGDIDLLYEPDLPYSGMAPTIDRIMYTHVNHTAALIAHEMGHIMGLSHYGDGVMNAGMTGFHISDEDCEALKHRTTYYTNAQ